MVDIRAYDTAYNFYGITTRVNGQGKADWDCYEIDVPDLEHLVPELPTSGWLADLAWVSFEVRTEATIKHDADLFEQLQIEPPVDIELELDGQPIGEDQLVIGRNGEDFEFAPVTAVLELGRLPEYTAGWLSRFQLAEAEYEVDREKPWSERHRPDFFQELVALLANR